MRTLSARWISESFVSFFLSDATDLSKCSLWRAKSFWISASTLADSACTAHHTYQAGGTGFQLKLTTNLKGVHSSSWQPVSEIDGGSPAIWNRVVLVNTRNKQVCVDLPTSDGWKAELTWVVGYLLARCTYWPIHRFYVSSSNRARRRVTSLIDTSHYTKLLPQHNQVLQVFGVQLINCMRTAPQW